MEAGNRIDPHRRLGEDAVEKMEGNPSFVAWTATELFSFILSNAFAFGAGSWCRAWSLLKKQGRQVFVLQPGHTNCLSPGKLPMHTLNCYMVLKDGVPYIVGGTPGGRRTAAMDFADAR
jgi:gamma-glutamyltranspeptidase/glutathione hydrolase